MSDRIRGRVTALLGPTNTGKTYLAIERLLGYGSGMIGFPLRLLARENYDRAVRLKGRAKVALVTGEEKIVPPSARYFFCTVESLPLDRPVEFLAIDEVQLAADPERGHVFTDRLLHARGSEETMLLGADTVRPLLRKLVPEAETVSRPRFSTLSYSGPKKITRLPPRSAVVAFSAADVYAMAELMRRRRGGTAVVLGALSPRTRNAQVAMFEAGEVDYLVATDAIGMGLNLNLDHVAFSRLSKFDGRLPRRLTPAEVAQIAGRAGRHMNDGTFGTTGELGGMDAELVEAVENHSFEAHRWLFWRNHRLDFRSPPNLLRSLEARPPMPELLRAREAEDHLALVALAGDPEIAKLAATPGDVALLWEVCQVPDFRKTLSDQHVSLLRRLYRHLVDGGGRLPEDWVAGQIARIDRPEGDIDALVARIAHVRTWTYVAHRGDWLNDTVHWQERTRSIEDRLSDALHERLTQRFVDRRTAALVRRLKDGDALIGAVRKSGEVLVEGEFVGRLEGFRFVPDESVEAEDAKALLTAARRALAVEIPQRLRRLEDEPDEAFALDEGEARGRITWRGAAVARLAAGAGPLTPAVEPLASEFLDGAQRERLRKRLAPWLERHLRRRLALLFRAVEADPGPLPRGLLYQLAEALGTLPRAALGSQIAALAKSDRRALAELGLRLGESSVFFPALLRPRAQRLRALLWSVHSRQPLPPLPAKGALCFRPAQAAGAEAFCHAIGFRRIARGEAVVAVRADALERLAGAARKLARQGAFTASPALQRTAGCGEDELAVLLPALGYRAETDATGASFQPRRNGEKPDPDSGRKRPRRRAAKRRGRDADSPFAKLRDLKIGP
ncbi:MAG: helicase-related protein [Rhodospirillales bacterium]|nr:helicase-related protein [Rhodospirillales bacterium]